MPATATTIHLQLSKTPLARGANTEAIYHAEGRLSTTNNVDFSYEYTLKDHLGNARVSFRAVTNGTAIQHLQENHYYPFGMEMDGPWQVQVGVENQYQYNGKELNEDFGLNLMDYGARWYDGALGRWGSVDPLAEKYYSLAPFTYVTNNPLIFIDPDGMKVEDYIFLNSKGQEIGRILDNNVKQVTFISDQNFAEYDALPYGRQSIEKAQCLGITYEMDGVLALYDNNSKDFEDPYQDGHLKIADGETGKPRYDIVNEHMGALKAINGRVAVAGDYEGRILDSMVPRASENDDVGSAHTHPNNGKKGVLMVANGFRLDFKDKGPSPSVDLLTQPPPKNGFFNIVVDDKNVYFYKGQGDRKFITIARSKL